MVEVNLLPAQYRKRSDPNAWRYATIAAPLVTAAVLVVVSIVTSTQLKNVNDQLDAVNGQISALETQKRESDDLHRQESALEQVTGVSDTLRASKTYWSTDLARFINALPTAAGVALTTLNMTATVPAAGTTAPRTPAAGTPATGTPAAGTPAAAVGKTFALTGQAGNTEDLVNFLNSFETNSNFTVSLQGAQRSGTGANAPYTFNATVGLLSSAAPVTPSVPTSGAPTSAAPASPAQTNSAQANLAQTNPGTTQSATVTPASTSSANTSPASTSSANTGSN